MPESPSEGEIETHENKAQENGGQQQEQESPNQDGFKGRGVPFDQFPAIGRCHGHKNEGSQTETPVEKGIGNDGAEPSEPVGHGVVSGNEFAPGEQQHFVLIELPGKKVRSERNEEVKSHQQEKHPEQLGDPFVVQGGAWFFTTRFSFGGFGHGWLVVSADSVRES